ncbi:MAG: GDP-mannose 4,6-dehydratase [Simkaniaceae bacterium]|nr:GDP-mannose 4,6-dehydratase [Simkaniaceae bacterium]MCF7852423.1 GDP-mannose 4,6-dehydratase [Simkaniaceae bacterium]
MRIENQSIYITGIAGFIGFHLASALHQLGVKVFGCDNYNDAYPPKIKHDRTAILKKKNIPIYNADISDFKKQEEIYSKERPTVVIHLAAQAGVRASIHHPQRFIDTNVTGFVNQLELMKIFRPAKFIYASSSSVYGDNTKFPLSESDPTDHPVSLYAATKKANELIAYAYHTMTQIPMIGLRFFTCYGPLGRPDMAIYLFTQNIINGDPITVYHEGKMKRDFTYIDDIVQGIIASIQYETSFDVFNLGKGHTDDLTKLISIIENRLGKKAKIDYQPRPSVDMPMNIADIEKSRKALGFTPSTPLDTGVNRFIDWYLKYVS